MNFLRCRSVLHIAQNDAAFDALVIAFRIEDTQLIATLGQPFRQAGQCRRLAGARRTRYQRDRPIRIHLEMLSRTLTSDHNAMAEQSFDLA